MALKSVVDDINSVPEAVRTEYTEKDGKFYLNVDDIDNHPGVSGLRSALKTERDNNKTVKDAIAAWKKIGKTPEEIAELVAAKEAAEAEAARKSGDFDSILRQHQDKAAKEKADLEAELNAARTSERSAIVGERFAGALVRGGATANGANALPKLAADRIKLETVDGGRVMKIMKADGVTPMAGSGADGTATLDDLVKELSNEYPEFFKGSGAGGGGKPPGDTGGGGSGATKKSDFKTEKERAAWVEKHGLPAYNALPA
jgi:DNA-binding transcriptional MerR regulator